MHHTFPFVRPPDRDETPLSPAEQIIAMRDHPVRYLLPVQLPRQHQQEAA